MPSDQSGTTVRDNAEFELLRSAYERRLRSFAEAIKEALKEIDRRESVLERLSTHFVHGDGEASSSGVLASIKQSADKNRLERETIEEESRLVELVASLESARTALSEELSEEKQRRQEAESRLMEIKGELERIALEHSRETEKSRRLSEELRVLSDRYGTLVADAEKSQGESHNEIKEMKRELNQAKEYTLNLKEDNERLNIRLADLEACKAELEERTSREQEQLGKLRKTLSATAERETAALAKLAKAESRLANCEAKLSGSAELVQNLREQLGKVEARDYEREGKLACLERRENKLQKRLTLTEEHLLKLRENNDQFKRETLGELKHLSKLAQEVEGQAVTLGRMCPQMRQEFKDVRYDIGKKVRMTEEWSVMKMDGLLGLLSHHRKAARDQARTTARVHDAERRSYDANYGRLEHELKNLRERAEVALAKQKSAEERLEQVLEAVGLGVLVPDPNLIRRTFENKIADITKPFEAKIFELIDEKDQLERELKAKLKALTSSLEQKYQSKIRELAEKSDCLEQELQSTIKVPVK
ncbi:hypothetical protein FOL47_003623 [Perkinsus chesapeaki]|uniref:Uncharacterized protein n=1 Tax=Perkinsus chesapeaki TaxID=330153 RepID=A0A7J6M725_PERCH|nr:hypothetical protein FOL47_003623 [Perkinsus chesapeaki]